MKAALVFVSICFLSPVFATNPHRFNYPNSPTPRQPGPYLSGDYVALGNRVVLEKITISQDEVADFIEANPNETLIVGGSCLGPCEQVPEGEIVPIDSLPPSQNEIKPQSLGLVASRDTKSNPTERNNLFEGASRNGETLIVSDTIPAKTSDVQPEPAPGIVNASSRLESQSKDNDTAKRQLSSFIETFSQPKNGLKLGTVAIAFPAAVAGSLLLLLLLSVAETLRRKRRETSKRAALSKYKKLALSKR